VQLRVGRLELNGCVVAIDSVRNYNCRTKTKADVRQQNWDFPRAVVKMSNTMYGSLGSEIQLKKLSVTELEHISRAHHKPHQYRNVAIVAFLAVSVSSASVGCLRTAARPLDSNQDVQPILASRCFSCHGPDPEMRKAGLRLDLAEWALRKRPNHPGAIAPGHPEKSELIKRIESRDPRYLMPRAAHGEAKPMSTDEIATLRKWIRDGAVYRPHWAFEVPVRPAASAPKNNTAWVKTLLDNFILAKLEKAGLSPSPEADRVTLIRRVTLDLAGLLPTLDEVLAFVNDASPDAYEHLVDGLLAPPTFGEQRARYWLDYARYADTYGLHFDNSRDIWPYRDYVIRSFNGNKPFDQFAMEQIAGDLLPMKNLDPLIGSGYVRLGVSSNEDGTIPEELRVNIARERTEAFAATFMGLTVGCAVCHDHKFDPTTQHDFYALSAFFNNLDEKPFNDDRSVWAPVVRIPTSQNQDAYNRVLAQRSQLQAEMNEIMRSHCSKHQTITCLPLVAIEQGGRDESNPSLYPWFSGITSSQ